ncbi:hypothetical protein DDB_G0294144, partial [Dictyostelium discoideum AX4]
MNQLRTTIKLKVKHWKKLIHRNFRSKTLVPFKTDYEAANTKVVEAINHRNCYSAQDVIKNIEAIMSYHNVINPVYLIHGTAEVQLEYLRSILDNNILALLKMVVPDWLQTDIAIKLNTQTDITECRETITEIMLLQIITLNNRNSFDAQADKIRAAILPEIRKDSKVDLKKIRSSFIVYRQSKGYCLNCGDESKSKILNKNYKISQYHHLEDNDYPVNKDSLYTLNSFYNQNIVKQLHQQSQQHDVHKNINKLKEYVKDSYGIKLVPDTTVPIPKAVESEMKYKPQKIEFNTPTELTNVQDKNYTVNIFNRPKILNSSKELINDEEDELLYTYI